MELQDENSEKIHLDSSLFIQYEIFGNEHLTFRLALKPIITLAVPNMFMFILQNLIDIISLIFIGHLENSSNYLAAVGLGTTWFNLTSYYILLGLTLVIDTLISQNYGKNDYTACGIYFYKTSIIVTFACILFIPLIMSCGFVMTKIGVDPTLAQQSGNFANYLIPSLFMGIHFEMAKKFLNAQQIVTPTTIIVLFTTILHILFCYLFITQTKNYIGAAYVKFITQFLNLALIWLYIYLSACCKEVLPKIQINLLFTEWKQILELAIPSALLMCFDFWVYEIMNLMLGLTSKLDLATNVGLSQISFILYMIPCGFGNAASTFVGNYIGKGDIKNSKFFMRISLILSGSTMIVFSILILIFKSGIANLYTSDQSVNFLFRTSVFAVILAELPDSLQVILSRTLVALGNPKFAAISMFISSYFILLPLGYLFLIILGWGVKGYWLSVMFCNIGLILAYTFCLYKKVNWKSLSENK